MSSCNRTIVFAFSALLIIALLGGGTLACNNTEVEVPQPPTTETEVQIEIPDSPDREEGFEKPSVVAPEVEKAPLVLEEIDLSHLISQNPKFVDNSDLPITPLPKWDTGTPPKININTYTLKIDGLVENQLELSYDDILSYPTVTEVVLLICEEAFAHNAQWTGVPVIDLIDEAGIEPEAKELVFYAADQYQRILPLDTVERPGVFLAHTANQEVLPVNHGYPLRLVVKGNYGFDWIKWLVRIEVR